MANITIATLFLSLLLFSTLCSAAYIPYRPRFFPPKEPPVNPFCPWDTLKFGACMDLVEGVGSLVMGKATGSKCCALLHGLTNAEAALCLCTTIKESVLGITTEWTVAVSLLVSSCKKKIPDGFRCV